MRTDGRTDLKKLKVLLMTVRTRLKTLRFSEEHMNVSRTIVTINSTNRLVFVMKAYCVYGELVSGFCT
jgi:hypothetical protein